MSAPAGEQRDPVVLIAHDYVTQRGGAERVVLSLLDAFPGSELVTSVYTPEATFPEFANYRIHRLWPGRLAVFRKDPRRAMPALASAFGFARPPKADVVICSSSGWAHGLNTDAPKIIYCHTPARWLYQLEDYLPEIPKPARAPVRLLLPFLRRWDRKAAQGAAVYIANSSIVRDRIRRSYGRDAEVINPPVVIDVDGEQEPIPGVEPGYLLCVSRARGYKNVTAICQAVADSPGERLVVVGPLPEGAVTDPEAARRITGVSRLSDAQMRWVYSNAAALIAVSREDFGLTPIEAYAFGTPAILLGAYGYLDSSIDGTTCVFIPSGDAGAIKDGIERFRATTFDPEVLKAHAETFSEARFHEKLRRIVADVVANSPAAS